MTAALIHIYPTLIYHNYDLNTSVVDIHLNPSLKLFKKNYISFRVVFISMTPLLADFEKEKKYFASTIDLSAVLFIDNFETPFYLVNFSAVCPKWRAK